MQKQKNAGFSLVEIIVALAILAIAASVILGSFTMAIKLNAKASREYEALGLAQVALEKALTTTTKEVTEGEVTREVTKNQIKETAKERARADLQTFLETIQKNEELASDAEAFINSWTVSYTEEIEGETFQTFQEDCWEMKTITAADGTETEKQVLFWDTEEDTGMVASLKEVKLSDVDLVDTTIRCTITVSVSDADSAEEILTLSGTREVYWGGAS